MCRSLLPHYSGGRFYALADLETASSTAHNWPSLENMQRDY